MPRPLLIMSFLVVAWPATPAQQAGTTNAALTEHNPRLNDFEVIEFRRYTLKAGQRAAFVQYFDTYFPEAFQQAGSIIAGSFADRENDSGFVWIKAFHTVDDHASVNGAFYFGSVWNEHRKRMNDFITNADNVLLLRPLSPEREIPILRAVDPVAEVNEARGVVVAQIFAVKANSIETFVKQAESAFASYRAAGVREAGVLVTLDAPNNFPQLTVRSDGPFLVWLGVLKDNQMLDSVFRPAAEQAQKALAATGLLRNAPELLALEPTPRSRLRWMP